MSDIDLSEFSVSELNDLAKDVDRELSKRHAEKKKEVSSQIKGLAASIGMTVEEVLGLDMARKTKTPICSACSSCLTRRT